MPVSAIFENIEAGASIDDILEWFEGLDRTQVEAVLEFVARSLDRAPEYISAAHLSIQWITFPAARVCS
jgi:uncharacterized protein (DUF433 family)